MLAFAQLLRAAAHGIAHDDERWRDGLAEASRRLEAEGEPLAVGFGLVASAVVALAHGRPDEARGLAHAAHDLSTRIDEWFVRMWAVAALARAAIDLADWTVARQHAVGAVVAARHLRNLYATSYALELRAAAELGDGRIEDAGRLFALSERGYRQAGSGPWRNGAELHRRLSTELHAAFGDRYEPILARAWDVDSRGP